MDAVICGQLTMVAAYVTGDPDLARLAQATATSDSAQLAWLLRRGPGICMDCAATKLVLTISRVGEAVRILAKTRVVNEAAGMCSGCGRSTPVLSLRPEKDFLRSVPVQSRERARRAGERRCGLPRSARGYGVSGGQPVALDRTGEHNTAHATP